MFVNFPNPADYLNSHCFSSIRAAALAACDAFDAQPNHGAPEAKRLMDTLREAATFHANSFSIEIVLRRLQHFTIMELANALDSTSIQIEVQKQTVTPEDLRRAAGLLRGYAAKVEAGDHLPKGPDQSLNSLQVIRPEESPSYHVCGAQMVPTGFKCLSCGASTEAT